MFLLQWLSMMGLLEPGHSQNNMVACTNIEGTDHHVRLNILDWWFYCTHYHFVLPIESTTKLDGCEPLRHALLKWSIVFTSVGLLWPDCRPILLVEDTAETRSCFMVMLFPSSNEWSCVSWKRLPLSLTTE